MTEKEKVIKRYNKIMTELSYEHLTIGTRYSENTSHFTLKDMVNEISYLLSTYKEEGHSNWYLKQDDYKRWLSDKGKLERFLNKYKGMVK